MKKATRAHTRHHNRRLILGAIYDSGETSRADLARQTRLTRPTVSTIVADLLSQGLIAETGQGPSAGGKPPILLSLSENSRQLLTVDLSGEYFRAAVIDLRGNILHRASSPATGLQEEAALSAVFALIEQLVPLLSAPLLGIGVASPGLVDPGSGKVLRSVKLGWVDMPLRQRLAEGFDCPVYIGNDSHMAALAEFHFGQRGESRNLIVLRVGQGIGAGIVLDGRPFYGDGFGAGEVGHVVIDDNGALCTCGNRGCLETVASVPAMLAQWPAGDSSDGAGWNTFSKAVTEHDEQAAAVVKSAGNALGIAAANLVGAFNIHHIVIAGRVTALSHVYLSRICDSMRRRALPAMVEATTLSYSSLGPDTVTLGCSALVLQGELGVLS